MAVPNIFANVTTSIPLSQLDTNFATAITLGNTAVYLGNTTTTLGNLTLTNVTISSGTSNLASTSIANGTSNVSISSSGGNITMATANTSAVTIDTNQNATVVGYINAPNTFGFKNRIINGNFGIWQRGTSSSAAGYLADRWQLENAGTYSQSTDVPSGQGFPYSCTVSVTTGTSYGVIKQKIEAANCTDLVGKNATLTFWVKNLTGSTSMTAILYNANSADDFSAVTSISSQSFTAVLNTWTKFTFNYTSLPSGAANGLQVYVFSADASVAPSYRFTGCQLEKGSIATSFDYRPYGIELVLCQRYFQLVYPTAGNATSAAVIDMIVSCFTPMRANPTLNQNGVLTVYDDQVGPFTQSSTSITNLGNPNPVVNTIRLSNFSGLTVNRFLIGSPGSPSNYVTLSAEL